jgi:hypothetical protein
MAICARAGCDQEGKPKFCSRRCSGLHNGVLRRGTRYYHRMGSLGIQAKRRKGVTALRLSDRLLMAAGRYEEAARALYDRGYSAGWLAQHKGCRQLPARRTA